jgi:Kef-type K+ transport system membrane component KefB
MIASIFPDINLSHIPVVAVIGLAIFFGTIGARLFQKLHIPQVVGYIAIGLLVGQSGLKLIPKATVHTLEPFSFFALGVIGFLIGGELHRDVFKKHGKQFVSVLVAEGLGAFVVVGLLVGSVAVLVTGKLSMSLALGLVFGAVASATAPAATVNVLWEYKTRGPLTSAVFAVVALDDGLALVLFSVASSVATKLTGHGSGGMLSSLGTALYELGGAVIVGASVGLTLNYLLRWARDHDNSLAFIVGAVALVIGIGRVLHLDTILATMALGVVLTNTAPRRSKHAFSIMERFAPPIYVLFFVLVGAHLDVAGLEMWMWALALPYVIGRTGGKILGTNLGARLSKAPEVVRKYLGLCLFCQGGVAIGLAIMASHRFSGEVGAAIIMIVTLTTFVVEIIGPPFVKLAVKNAGEIGLNVTEEDLMARYTVGDMVDSEAPTFEESATVDAILRTISQTDAMAYPVIDAQGRLSGVISLQDLKSGFRTEGLSRWLVAFDLMQPVPDTVTLQTPLQEAVTRMREQELDYLPVVKTQKDPSLVGMLEARVVTRALSREVVKRRQKAETGT